MRKWKGPQIPRSLLHSMYEVHTEGGGYDKEQGGQWKPGTTVETAFQGVVMPLNNEDLQYIDSGSYTLNAQKVYTNGHCNDAEPNYQAQYDYFKAGNSKVANKHSATGTAAVWWLRSPNYYGVTSYYYFCAVSSSGSLGYHYASYAYGVVPGFVV